MGLLNTATFIFANMSLQTRTLIGWALYIIFVVAILAAQLHYRRNSKAVSYGDAYLVAAYASLFAAATAAISIFALLNADPHVLSLVHHNLVTYPGHREMTPEHRQKLESEELKLLSPLGIACMTAVALGIYGLVIGLITSIFTRRK